MALDDIVILKPDVLVLCRYAHLAYSFDPILVPDTASRNNIQKARIWDFLALYNDAFTIKPPATTKIHTYGLPTCPA